MVLPGRLAPAEMFPATRNDLRTLYLDLPSGLRVRATEAGDESAPPVVLFPGWGCSTYVFRDNLSSIATAGFRAIAVDLKGHGLSDKPVAAEEYSLESMVRHVNEISQAIGAERIVVGGLSMGAALAGHVAAAQPDRIRGVILISPVGFNGVSKLWLIEGLTPRIAAPVLPRLAGRWLIRLLLANVGGHLRHYTEEDVEEYWAPTQFPEFAIAMRHLIHRFEWNSGFPVLRTAPLVIAGTHDRFARPGAHEQYLRAWPDMRWLEIAGAGHVVIDEAPPLVNQTMIDYLRSLPA